MKYIAKENTVTFQNRKGLDYEIQPYSKYSIIEEETTLIIAHIPDFVKNQKEVAERIARLLTEEMS